MSTRNIVIGSVALGCLVVCACALAVVAASAAIYFVQVEQTANVTPTPSGPVDPEALAAEMDAIEQQVIEMRGLQPTGPVDRKFMTVEEVKQRTLDDFNEDTTPEEWADYTHTMVAYGMVPPEIDLYNLLLRLYSEGVAGFYDPDTGELVIVSGSGTLNAYEQVTFAHETNHALQDQNYDLEGLGFNDEDDTERAMAIRALTEGDATVLEEQYKETFSRAELKEYNDIIAGYDVSIYFELPEFMLLDFLFPYDQGAAFVRRYHQQGGWARVDEVWHDPPLSTEHILHPERYEAGDAPIIVDRPALTDTLGSGWRQIDSGVSGEWFTYLMLAYGDNHAARLSTSTAERAAAGWGGDGYVAYYHAEDDQLVLAQHWVWDTADDAGEFNKAFETYGNGRWGKAERTEAGPCWREARQQHCLLVNGQHSLWLTAPDAVILEAVLALYPELR